MPSPLRTLLLAATACSALVLTGCGGDDAPSSPAVTADAATAVVGDQDGSVAAPGRTDTAPADVVPDRAAGTPAPQDLPPGYPSAEVPVVDGTVTGGSTGDAPGPYAYTVLVQVRGSTTSAVMREVSSRLRRAGFTASPGMTVGQISTAQFLGPSYRVGVNVVGAASDVTVTYVIRRR